MTLSAFDIFSIGIGPSSSHTVGPMKAAKRFVDVLDERRLLEQVARVRAELLGSLGATGRGHGSPKAVLLGLAGEDPATVEVEDVDRRVSTVAATGDLLLGGRHAIRFDPGRDIVLEGRRALPEHPNGMRFTAYAEDGVLLQERTYFSVGGGFVLDPAEAGRLEADPDRVEVPFPFSTASELLEICTTQGWQISDVMLANERAWRSDSDIRAGLLEIWHAMESCVRAGCRRDDDTELPGGLRVRRRAPALHQKLTTSDHPPDPDDPMRVLDWVNLFALAVNEENASGGRVVTAPTNGAAGIVPAVLHYYMRFVPGADEDGVVRFLLTAAAIGILFKLNASISGAEVGCQGEVGSACAMAAGALCELLGGSPAQVENAAEIGVEHHLGLTCDPIGGLVQIPCIERNAIASVKAINAARLATHGDGSHRVSLDEVIRTVRDTGRDMDAKYKETSRGGLAVNVVEC
ncbi:L-serine dehydratase [Nocardioides terrae]|uniref:L-serine dehydratase n=1 Tax=Nocardioides terrae TaxID=574651 RepID=A0A1I1N963_9ACTN|nr:L-serine ammonia-lyase [Nocardioides terrae]SFC94169.1 L-serine dehydratase [Nocardioides terrae]